jgi:truncated hemoglobin YjbI
MLGAAVRSRFAVLVAVPAVALVALVACGPKKPAVEPEAAEPEPAPTAEPAPPPPAPASLYDRLGKHDALDGVVEELLGNVLADRRINKLFDKARKDKERTKQLHARLVAELCVVAGGGDECAYDGKSMKDAHKGMNIGEAQWNAFIEDLTIALKTRSVDDALSKELIDQLEQQTKADIVTPGKGK